MRDKKIATIAALSSTAPAATATVPLVAVILRSGLLIALMAGILILMDARALIVTPDREIARPPAEGGLAVGIEPRPAKKKPIKVATIQKTKPRIKTLTTSKPKTARTPRVKHQTRPTTSRSNTGKPTTLALVPKQKPTPKKPPRVVNPQQKKTVATRPSPKHQTPIVTKKSTITATKPTPTATRWAAREINAPIPGAYVIVYLKKRVMQIRVGRERVRRYSNISLPTTLGKTPRVKGWYYYLHHKTGGAKGARSLAIAYLSPEQASALRKAGKLSATSEKVVTRANAAAGDSPLAAILRIRPSRANPRADAQSITLPAEDLYELTRALSPGAWIIIKP